MGNALAMTWDRQHVEDEAKASGREFYLMGYNLINGESQLNLPASRLV
jgi:beta-glucosidase